MPVNVEPTAGVPAPATAPIVEPRDDAAPAPPEVESTGEATGEDNLPSELLQIPVFQGLMSGQPPAVSTLLKAFTNRPEARIIAENKGPLQQAGINFYRALDGNTGVIFNSLYVKPADIQAADKAGRLAEIAPPFDDVNGAVLQSGQDNPVLRMGSVPGGPAGAAPAIPQMGSQRPPASGLSRAAEKKITGARLKNLQTGPPDSGAKPGAGRLLNSLLKTPV